MLIFLLAMSIVAFCIRYRPCRSLNCKGRAIAVDIKHLMPRAHESKIVNFVLCCLRSSLSRRGCECSLRAAEARTYKGIGAPS